jgi:hypothetical protein
MEGIVRYSSKFENGGPDSRKHLWQRNVRLARKAWQQKLSAAQLISLKTLSEEYGFSLPNGDIQLIEGGWYVTHTGLIRLSCRKRCFGIQTYPIQQFCDATTDRYGFRAVVYKTRHCKGFVGYGDADPSNVSPVVHGAEMRVAETRAVNRALRKAYGIGICSVEEIGSFAGPAQMERQPRKLPAGPANGNVGNGNGTRVRDRLCQIIRQHRLDATLVKSYAVDFCGAKTLRDATREQVENFVVHLADWAEKDRNALLCQLNSYLRPQEGAA